MKAGCIGELVIDFIGTTPARSIEEASRFVKCPGGSPANVAVSLHHQGIDTTLISRVGPDRFGSFMLQAVEAAGLSVDAISTDSKHATRCVFMVHDEAGRRSVEIANRQSADQFMPPDQVRVEVLDTLDLLHVGGTTMLGEITATTTLALVNRVKKNGGVVSFDPNINLNRISDAAKQRMVRLLAMVDILKVNEDEWSVLNKLLDEGDKPGLVVCTQGAAGATVITPTDHIEVATSHVDVVDVTGAGDAFFGAFLGELVRTSENLLSPSVETLDAAAHRGNTSASDVVQHLGGFLSQQSFPQKHS